MLPYVYGSINKIGGKGKRTRTWRVRISDGQKFDEEKQKYVRKYLAIGYGVILPDFSLYRDMPFVMQLWNIYHSRAIGHWLQLHGVKVIPNIRFGDKRTYRICCDGISKHCVIAVGSHGNLKKLADREIFLKGLDVVVQILHPTVIIIYGSASDKYFKKYKDSGIKIIQFESECANSHKGVA